jgi:hypothetical protein
VRIARLVPELLMNWLIDLMTIDVLLIRALALQAEYVSMCVYTGIAVGARY